MNVNWTLMSLATSVKDYVEITHKLIEIEPLKNYTEFGAIFTYFIFSVGEFFKNFFSFSLLKNIWSIHVDIPDIASAMISEVSVLDGYFHNAFTFLETNVNTGTNTNLIFFEKFIIGFINSIFLILPTSTSHLITLRRFVMQGLEAGYLAGLGTLAGNFLWLTSIILGWRFFVIPWLSLDIFRYILGFVLLVKYIWDSSKEKRMVLEDLSKWKIFLLNFLLALTEQSCIYPFISNLSIGPETSILEGFPVENYSQFLLIHGAYLFGILLGSFSLLQLTCWFWENPAFSIYLWLTSTKSGTSSALTNFLKTSSYYNFFNFFFLYATMLCAIASVPYYGLDYTITNPIGLVPQDRMLDQKKSQSNPDKLITETAFLGLNPTDKNARIRDGVHARRERWKQRLIKYQAFDASIYDQGVYDFLTIEDLNYGFDRFWLRRKMRNHQIRFRLFPGPWMRSLKKQLNSPAPSSNDSLKDNNEQRLTERSTKATTGARVEFFRILFEQFYHPNFHQSSVKNFKMTPATAPLEDVQRALKITRGSDEKERQLNIQTMEVSTNNLNLNVNSNNKLSSNSQFSQEFRSEIRNPSILGSIKTVNDLKLNIKPGIIYSNSALRKYVRNVNTRINLKLLTNKQNNLTKKYNSKFIYSKRWREIFTKIIPSSAAHAITKTNNYELYRNLTKQLLLTSNQYQRENNLKSVKSRTLDQKLSAKERKLLSLYTTYNRLHTGGSGLAFTPALKVSKSQNMNFSNTDKLMLLRPLNVYLQKEQAFKRKLRYYGATPLRKLTVGNQAPYFKALMKRGFYFYKPSLRWKKTLYVASMRRGFRKKSRKQLTYVPDMPVLSSSEAQRGLTGSRSSLENIKLSKDSLQSVNSLIIPPTHSYTVFGKRASRYRHQIYKDVQRHWYYSPFNRLLLKFDIDAFINRQPKSHFLTKNEERILHLRRFLLSNHYDTLRWYTYMQHYKTMKTNIGGTKSFANRIYNQQFQGTFKKIRHLFAITPKQGDFYTLKFDQPLYNERQLKDNVYLHEELLNNNLSVNRKSVDRLSNQIANSSSTNVEMLNSSLTSNSNNKLASSFEQATNPKNLELNLNTLDLVNLSSLLIGQKTNLASTNQSLSIPRDALRSSNAQTPDVNFVYNELFVKLIKECKKRIYDQTFLKHYITHRIEKREQLNQEQIKEVNKRLEKLKIWLTAEPKTSQKHMNNFVKQDVDDNLNKIATTGIQKAVNDSLNITDNSNLLNMVFNNLEIAKSSKDFVNQRENKTTYKELDILSILQQEQSILNKLNLINRFNNENQSSEGIRVSKIKSLTDSKISDSLKISLILKQTIQSFKSILLQRTALLQTRADKNLEWWRQKQRVITKRKNLRKRDRFKKQKAAVEKKIKERERSLDSTRAGMFMENNLLDYLLPSKVTDITLLRQKRDFSKDRSFVPQSIEDPQINLASKAESLIAQKAGQSSTQENLFVSSKNNFSLKQLSKGKLRKKLSSKGRRYRSLSLSRYLTATRKPRLVGLNDEALEIDNVSNLNGAFLTKQEKQEGLNNSVLNNMRFADSLKKSQIKKRSRHSWKKRVRHQFSRNHYKYRKRHIHGKGKLRMISKKIKKILKTNELRQWWWSSFLPRYLNNLDTISTNLKRTSTESMKETQIKYKPLSNSDFNTNRLNNSGYLLDNLNSSSYVQQSKDSSIALVKQLQPNWRDEMVASAGAPTQTLYDQASFDSAGELPKSGLSAIDQVSNHLNNSNSTTSLPFYAGWDESLRKFVVTNRLLSRRDSGLIANSGRVLVPTAGESFPSSLNKSANDIYFKNAPIQGLNEGSFLYWQTDMPFNSYNIDQFITTNQSFYAPLGWRRFEFRHSILKNWMYSKPFQSSLTNISSIKENKTLLVSPAIAISKDESIVISKKQIKNLKNLSVGVESKTKDTIRTNKFIARRVKKRYKLLKQMPNQLIYSPTGPLLMRVLPSHYISVFDQQYRFPRNRYLKRNPSKTVKKTTLLTMIDSANQTSGGMKDFTLRKRIKPRRKYHRKRFIKKDGLIFPRRTKFTTLNNLELSADSLSSLRSEEDLRWRPSSRTKQKRKESIRSKSKLNKRVKTNPLRLRQLRRREFQQILKPTQRYIPQNGGFTWPGDYLRLEIVEMPKLKNMTSTDKEIQSSNLSQRETKPMLVQPVGIMPRKYLIEKHNLFVLKKKLSKAYSSQILNNSSSSTN